MFYLTRLHYAVFPICFFLFFFTCLPVEGLTGITHTILSEDGLDRSNSSIINQKLHDAYQAYQLALKEETTLAEQEKYFNRALALYHEVEEQLSPFSENRVHYILTKDNQDVEPDSIPPKDRDHSKETKKLDGQTKDRLNLPRVCEKCGLGPLFYNMGNIYFYLSEYPLAITYYYRAAQTMPDDPLLVQNLNKALEKIHLGQRYNPPSFTYFEILEFLGSLIGLAFLLFSLWIWVKNPLMLFSGIGVSIVGLFFLGIAIFTNIFSSIDAIVLTPTLLHKGASEESPIINDNPLYPGTKVNVLDIAQEGKWLKISNQGEIGYLSYETIRVI